MFLYFTATSTSERLNKYVCIVGLLSFWDEREKGGGRGSGRLLSCHFSIVHEGMRRGKKMSLVEISNIWEPTEQMYYVYAFGLT